MDEMYGIRTAGDDAADYYSDKALLMISPDDQNMNNHLLPADYGNYNLHQYHYNPPPSSDHHHHRRIEFDPQSEGSGLTNPDRLQPSNDYEVIKARIASHPSYPKLLNAYIDCQKVGAPPEIAFMLEEISREKDEGCKHDIVLGLDPELDDFMESYYDVLVKYKMDLSRPIEEATSFISSIETQLANLCSTKSADDDTVSSEEEFSGVQDPTNRTEDRELKDQLMRRYGNHINSLKVEFSKKKKKGKLPKEARQTLLEWWSVHYKWPYPTEVDKISLAETTGLDQKQINNWFINQRKRHWKPSENMHLAMMDHNQSGHFFLED